MDGTADIFTESILIYLVLQIYTQYLVMLFACKMYSMFKGFIYVTIFKKSTYLYFIDKQVTLQLAYCLPRVRNVHLILHL